MPISIGVLTAPFGREPLLPVIDWAGKHGFSSLEVAVAPRSAHCDVQALDDRALAALQQACSAANTAITALAFYANQLDPDLERRKAVNNYLKSVVDVTQALGLSVVCAGGGMPLAGKDRLRTIREDVPDVYGPLVEYAASKGVKIALENWFATNLQGFDTFDAMFEAVPNINFGLNYDPSHLIWQGVDYIDGVSRYADRIFYVHGKDCEILEGRRRFVGWLSRGWWRYTIPGTGAIDWGTFIGRLRTIRYSGPISIEHEDSSVGREQGFLLGKRFLETHLAG
ncbi:MAG: sugar phosphate isomerase/epimerase [Chloroflexi bacterium]|nr:sugar phosphate isomerase/epimerase [Chloroflexota bacterium]